MRAHENEVLSTEQSLESQDCLYSLDWVAVPLDQTLSLYIKGTKTM